jgi:autotransporter-associated beta strand protein
LFPSQTGVGPLLVNSAELEVSLSTAGASLTNASAAFNGAILDFNFNQGIPGATAPLTVVGGLTNAGSTTINIVGYSALSVGTLPLIHYGSYQSNASSSFSLGPLPGTGGTAFLTNDAVNQNISLVVPKFDGFIWTGAADNNWDTTTLNWADITTLAPTAYGLSGFARFYDSGNNTAIQVTSDPQPTSIIVSNNTKAYSFNGAGIGGTAALIKRGTGTLTVAVQNNNSGGTIIEKGNVNVGDGATDGMITAPIKDNGALVYNVLYTSTASGITGTGTVTKAGSGQLSLGGGSTYTGATTVQAGQLHVTDSAALGATNSGTTVQSGSGLWVAAGGLTIREPLTLSGSGVSGEGALVAAELMGASTWSGPLTVTADTVMTANIGAALTIAGGLASTNKNLAFSADSTGYILVSNSFSAASVRLTNTGGLHLAGANPTLTNLQVISAVPNSSAPPATAGLWARNNQALGTNSIVTLTHSDYVGGTGARLGLDNTVTIPAGVALQAYCPGDGLAGAGGYRCSLSVLASTTNTWNGPITLHGANPALGVTSVFILTGGNSGTTGRLVVNGSVTVADGVVTVLPRGWNSGQFNGPLSLGTNMFAVTDGARWTVASTGNTWGLTQIGSSSATLALGTNNALCTAAPFQFLQAGIWDLNGFNQQVAGIYGPGGTVVNAATNAAALLTVSGANPWTFGGTLAQSAVTGAKSLGLTVTNGAGLTLTAANNNYAGPTVIANGATLALANNGTTDGGILNSSVKVQAGGTFDVSARADGTFPIGSLQVLSGNGTVKGSLTNNGTLAPGESVGNLTVTANVALGLPGNTVMEVNNATHTNDLLTVGGTLVYGGTLLLTNVSGTLYTNNQVLKLFSAAGGYTGSFTNIVFPGPTSYDATALTLDGTVRVVSVIPTTPTNLAFAVVSGGTGLQLTWPASYTGWRLQSQTNSLSTGLTSGWHDVAGATGTNQMTFPMNPANPTVFFRLTYP